jgi:N-acetylmuramoyl-L-alanine amidase
MITLIAIRISVSYGYDYLCIDPGHGGPGARKYGCNGGGYNNNRGAVGPIDTLTEQWVNLQVGLKLEYVVDMFAWPYNATITRDEDTANKSLEMRADVANKANNSEGVNTFISVHHNGLPLGKQGIETWWCAAETTDSGWARDTTDLLAKKIRWRLRDMWHYCSRCERDPDNCSTIVNMNCEGCISKKILRLVKMASVLTEASNLYNAHEESLFNAPLSEHIDSEVVAIYHGWHSFLMDAGVVTVTYAYEGGYEGKVIIDDDTVTTPFRTCWEFGEEHFITCKGIEDFYGYTYTFNHWNHDWVLPHDPDACWWEPYYDTTWYVDVPVENDHNYYSYMSGGPHLVTVEFPNGPAIWHIGEQRYIHWTASPGADSSNKVDIQISRDGGSSWQLIMPDLDYDFNGGGYYLWTVSGPASTHCRIKVTAHDCAENISSDMSDWDFIIGVEGNNDPEIDGHLQCKYPEEDCCDCIHYGDTVTIEIEAHDPDGDSMFYEWYCWFGHFLNGSSDEVTTAQNFVTYVAPTKGIEGEIVPFEDALSVCVTDVRGGQNWAVGNPQLYDQPYSCLCGDADNSGVVTGADIVYLLTYLYRGGFPPPDPILRGDANNDCCISGADPVYLSTYLFRYGSPPECCWFTPTEGKGPMSISKTD